MKRTRKKRRFWTPDEDQRMLDMLSSGVPPRTTARRLGRSYHGLCDRLDHLNVHRLALWRDGLIKTRNLADIGRLFGVSALMVRHWVAIGWLVARRDNRASKTKRWWFVHDTDLQTFVDRRETWMGWEPSAITDPDWREYAEQSRRMAGGHWVPVREIARRYYVDVSTALLWLREGRLPSVRHGLACYVWSSDLDRFVPPYKTQDYVARNRKVAASRYARKKEAA